MKKIKFTKKQKDQFKKLGIEIIYLFGSYARGEENTLSDLDIGIVFKNPDKHKDKTMPVYLKLYSIISDILPDVKQIDIVFLQLTSLPLQIRAINDGQILYQADKTKHSSYKEKVCLAHADFKYFFDLQDKALIERI